jgi:NADH:ubiquinone oxidoreductase subunit 4 (subunit M)
LAPLAVATLFFGIYPKPMFAMSEAALENLMARNRFAVSAYNATQHPPAAIAAAGAE